VPKNYAVNAYENEGIKLHTFLTSALSEGEWVGL
jgi:hypothetical protein